MDRRLPVRPTAAVGVSNGTMRSGKEAPSGSGTPLIAAPSSGDASRLPPASSNRTTMGPSHAVLGLGSSSLKTVSTDNYLSAKRPRKERGPNWNPLEIKALIEAKRVQYQKDLSIKDERERMTNDAGKWQRVSADVMKAGASPCHRDASACKSKWNLLIPDYKRIADFFARSGTNDASYWNMSGAEKKTEGLPRSFPQDVFHLINDWYGITPTMTPPHCRDLMSAGDGNFRYRTPVPRSPAAPHIDDSDAFEEDSVDVDDDNGDSDDLTGSTKSPAEAIGSPSPIRSVPSSAPSLSPSPGPAPRTFLPPGVIPQLISSSDTSGANVNVRPANTGIRRKNLSGHSIIAEATRITGEAMSDQMKDIAAASRQLERSKIEVNLRLFNEQMLYQRERDNRLHLSARIANENARLAIQKQSDVVSCLSKLSTVISEGFRRQGMRTEIAPTEDEGTSPEAHEDTVPVATEDIEGEGWVHCLPPASE